MLHRQGVFHDDEDRQGGDPLLDDRFLTAGGLTLAIALAQELALPDRDWSLIATMAAGILVNIGGGAYGRITAQGPISSILPKQAG